MILYHGTNQDIDSIDLAAGSRFKDFGPEAESSCSQI